MSTKTRETIKSLILVVLFIATILLLYLVSTGNKKIDVSKLLPSFEKESSSDYDSKALVAANTVIYRNGLGDIVSVKEKDELYSKLCAYLQAASNQGASMVNEISGDELNAILSDKEALEFDFGYSIPFVEYCKAFNINRHSGFSNIKNVSSIILSDGAEGSVIMKDSENEKYYKIITESTADWKEEVIGSTSLDGDSLYLAEQVLGVNNDIYIPVGVRRNTEEVYFLYEEFKDGSFMFENAAEFIFGDAISFVRKIKDSFGNLTYMYGYGEKTLSVSASGTLEYRNTVLNDGESGGFFADLQTAISFAENCGGFGTQSSETQLKLTKVTKSGSEDNPKYTYCFHQFLDGEIISSDEENAIIVSVENGQISSYYRKLISAIKSYAVPVDVIQAANAISEIAKEKYEEYIKLQGSGARSSGGASDAYTYTAMQIKEIKTCYRMENHFLVPSWQIDFKDGSRTWIGLSQKQF